MMFSTGCQIQPQLAEERASGIDAFGGSRWRLPGAPLM